MGEQKIEQPFMKAVKQTLDERCNETIEEIYKIAIKLIIETIAEGYGAEGAAALRAPAGDQSGRGAGEGKPRQGAGGGGPTSELGGGPGGAGGSLEGAGRGEALGGGGAPRQHSGRQLEGLENGRKTSGLEWMTISASATLKSGANEAASGPSCPTAKGAQRAPWWRQWSGRGDERPRSRRRDSSGLGGRVTSGEGAAARRRRRRPFPPARQFTNLARQIRLLLSPKRASLERASCRQRKSGADAEGAPLSAVPPELVRGELQRASGDRQPSLMERQASVLLEKLQQTVEGGPALAPGRPLGAQTSSPPGSPSSSASSVSAASTQAPPSARRHQEELHDEDEDGDGDELGRQRQATASRAAAELAGQRRQAELAARLLGLLAALHQRRAAQPCTWAPPLRAGSNLAAALEC